jgi:hypothetical protein
MMMTMTTIMMMKITSQVEATLTDILLSASKHDSHVMYCLSVTRIIQNSNNGHNVAIKTITIHVIEVVISIATIITYLHNYI